MRDAELSEVRRQVAILLRRQAEVGLSGAMRARLDVLTTRVAVLEQIEREILGGYAPVAA